MPSAVAVYLTFILGSACRNSRITAWYLSHSPAPLTAHESVTLNECRWRKSRQMDGEADAELSAADVDVHACIGLDTAAGSFTGWRGAKGKDSQADGQVGVVGVDDGHHSAAVRQGLPPIHPRAL